MLAGKRFGDFPFLEFRAKCVRIDRCAKPSRATLPSEGRGRRLANQNGVLPPFRELLRCFRECLKVCVVVRAGAGGAAERVCDVVQELAVVEVAFGILNEAAQEGLVVALDEHIEAAIPAADGDPGCCSS